MWPAVSSAATRPSKMLPVTLSKPTPRVQGYLLRCAASKARRAVTPLPVGLRSTSARGEDADIGRWIVVARRRHR